MVMMIRTTRRTLPRRLRVSPLHDFAVARTKGKLLEPQGRRLSGAA
jgi:hypothetical protein